MSNWKEILDIITTNILVFLTLLILTRTIGRKQLSQVTFFNYITAITLGSIAANAVNLKINAIYDEYIALVSWSILTILVGIISLKFPNLRIFIDGQPTIIIKKGKIQKKALKKLEMNIDDLLMLLRTKDVFNIKDVYYAIIESNGEITILKDVLSMQVTKKDMHIKDNNKKFIPSEIIVDGNLVKHNLRELSIDLKWLNKELKRQGITNIKDVLYAELQDDGSLYIDTQNKNHS